MPALLLVICGLALAPAIAHAGFGAAAIPEVPVPEEVAAGQTNVPAQLVLENRNNGPDANTPNTLCNDNDPFPCPVGHEGITLTPSCAAQSSGTDPCDVSGHDPGVYAVSSTGVGAAGSACAARIFDVSVVDPASGRVRFTPRPDATGPRVILPVSGAVCRINFSVDVLKAPTRDQDRDPANGLQTLAIADAPQTSPPTFFAGGRGSSNARTVRGQPTIATVASPDVVLNSGGTLTDQATVSGLSTPMSGATVTFRLYAPSQPDCLGNPVFTSIQPVSLAGSVGTATSGAYTPTVEGLYHWVAAYSGDAFNAPVSGACNDANETVRVTSPPTTPASNPGTTPPPAAQGVASANPVCVPPPGPAPAGGELCARGTAAIRGKTGCQGVPFRVVVSGRQIERVIFTIDGKVVRTLTRPNSAGRYALPVNPRTLRTGVHRVLARTIFRKQSGTRTRTLRVTFSRCARQAVSPAFTG